MPEYTYYAQCRDTTRIKIGLSADPARRIADLNSGSSTLVELLAKEPGGRSVESARHSEFRAARVQHLSSREWFYPVPPLLNLITSLGGRASPDPIVPEVVSGWHQADLRAKMGEAALKEARGEREELRRSLDLIRPLHDLVYCMMRIRYGYHRARPHAPRDSIGISKRAVDEAADLITWLSPAMGSRMDTRELTVEAAVQLIQEKAAEAADRERIHAARAGAR